MSRVLYSCSLDESFICLIICWARFKNARHISPRERNALLFSYTRFSSVTFFFVSRHTCSYSARLNFTRWLLWPNFFSYFLSVEITFFSRKKQIYIVSLLGSKFIRFFALLKISAAAIREPFNENLPSPLSHDVSMISCSSFCKISRRY